MQFGTGKSTAGVKLGDNRVMKWQRQLRKVFFVTIAVMVIWFFVQIGKYGIAPNNDAMRGTFKPGSSVVYDRFFDWHDGLRPFFGIKNRSILRGNIVIFLKEDLDVVDPETVEKKTGDYYGISRVIGIPGDTIRFGPKGVYVGEREGNEIRERLFPASHNRGETGPEEILPDRFFILNDNTGSRIQDSRQFGCIRGEELKGKVLVALKLW